MVFPLLPLMVGGLATSGGANLYSQYKQRKVYQMEARHNKALYDGYVSFLGRKGLNPNPDRSWNSYYGAYYRARNNQDISYAASLGTLGGTLGAGAGLSRGLYSNTGKTSRWL